MCIIRKSTRKTIWSTITSSVYFRGDRGKYYPRSRKMYLLFTSMIYPLLPKMYNTSLPSGYKVWNKHCWHRQIKSRRTKKPTCVGGSNCDFVHHRSLMYSINDWEKNHSQDEFNKYIITNKIINTFRLWSTVFNGHQPLCVGGSIYLTNLPCNSFENNVQCEHPAPLLFSSTITSNLM
jgi:hypothetical protein